MPAGVRRMFYIRPDPNAVSHMKERFTSLFDMDPIRFMKLMESLQYGVSYLIAGFFIGAVLDTAFPLPDEKKSSTEIFLEVLGQSLLLILAVFYTRKIVKIIPFLFTVPGYKYRPYETSEYSGEVMIAIILIGSQFSLLKKIDTLSRRFYKEVVQEEKNMEKS